MLRVVATLGLLASCQDWQSLTPAGSCDPLPTVSERATDLPAWLRVADLPAPARSALGVAADRNGLVYAIGGNNGGGVPLSNVDRYDPASDTWQPVSAITARWGLAAVRATDGRILVIGGTTDGTKALGLVEAYDPAAGVQPAPSLLIARTDLAGSLGSDDRIYALAGGDGAASFTSI